MMSEDGCIEGRTQSVILRFCGLDDKYQSPPCQPKVMPLICFAGLSALCMEEPRVASASWEARACNSCTFPEFYYVLYQELSSGL